MIDFNKFGVVFTVVFVGFMLIILILLSDENSNDSDFYVMIVSGLVLALFAYSSIKKNPKEKFKMTVKSYLIFFTLGSFMGVGILFGMTYAYEIDYQTAPPEAFYYGIPLAIGGQAGFHFFIMMAMAVSILNIPLIRQKIPGSENTRWYPFVGGVTVGFGIVTTFNFFTKGIPSLW